MKRFTLWLLPVLSAVLCILAIVHVVRSRSDTPQASNRLAEPAMTPFDETVAGAGLVEASTENVEVGSPLSGIVQQVEVQVGQQVRQNDPLFKLDPRQLEAERRIQTAAVSAAKAELNRLKSLPREENVPVLEAEVRQAQAVLADKQQIYERAEALVADNAISREDYQSAQLAVASARAQAERAEAELALLKAGSWQRELDVADATLQRAKAQLEAVETDLDRLFVKAPLDGTVLQVNVRPGEFVGAPPNEPLIVLGNTQRLHVRVDIDEYDIARFDSDQPAVAKVKGDSTTSFPLSFVRVEPFVIPKTSLTGESTERTDIRVLQVIYNVEITNQPLYVGQQLDVFIRAAPNNDSTPSETEPRSGSSNTRPLDDTSN